MYVATIPNRTSPPAILLRESFRQHGKVQSRTLANLSAWPPARVEALRRLLRGELDTALVADPTTGPVFGLLFALKHLGETLGLTAALGTTRLAKLALFLVLARVAHQGSRLSAVRWAADQAVAEVLGLGAFDEEDLSAALDDLAARQARIEQALFRRYRRRQDTPSTLFLYDVTSRDLEGEQNALGAFGDTRDGKRGKRPIVIGLLADGDGEPLAVRVFAGNTADPTTVGEQIAIVQQQVGVEAVVFVGDRGMVKRAGREALDAAGFRYITALTDPQIRRLLRTGTLQWPLFSEEVCAVEADGIRYVLRKNADEAARVRHRLDDTLATLTTKVARRNEQVAKAPRCRPEAGCRSLQAWIARHQLTGVIDLRVEHRTLVVGRHEGPLARALDLAGCSVVVTNVAPSHLSAQAVHDAYVSLQRVEREFRQMKMGLLEVRPVFVRNESRTRGHVFCCLLALKLSRELERRLHAAFGTTDANPHAITLPDAMAALSRLCLLEYRFDAHTTVTRLPQPDPRQQAILAALQVRLPEQ